MGQRMKTRPFSQAASAKKRALLIFFLVCGFSVAGAFAQAQTASRTVEFPFDQTDQKNEYPLGDIRRAVQAKTNDSEFFYVNPALRPDACARPLSVEEKIDQQAGRSYARILQGQNQLARYRDGWLSRVIDHNSWLEWFLAQYKWNHFWTFATHPTIAAATADLFEIRERTWRLQEREYGKGDGVGESDAADAFRHFVGAGLLFLRFGAENTETILRVHEQDDVSMSSLMDRYNNRVAMKVVGDLVARGELPLSTRDATESQLITRAKALIDSGELVVLRSQDRSVNPLALPGGLKFRAWAHRLLEKTLD